MGALHIPIGVTDMGHKPEDYTYTAKITVDDDEMADYTVITGLDTLEREKLVDRWSAERHESPYRLQEVFWQNRPDVWQDLIEECGGATEAHEALDRVVAWMDDKWSFIYVSLEIADGVHVKPLFYDSLGGIESDTDYYKTVISDMAQAAIKELCGRGFAPSNIPVTYNGEQRGTLWTHV